MKIQYLSTREKAIDCLQKAAEIRGEILAIKYDLSLRQLLYYPYRYWLKRAHEFIN